MTATASPVTAHQLSLRYARALGAAEACIKSALIECEVGRPDRARIILKAAQEVIEWFLAGKGEDAQDAA